MSKPGVLPLKTASSLFKFNGAKKAVAEQLAWKPRVTRANAGARERAPCPVTKQAKIQVVKISK